METKQWDPLRRGSAPSAVTCHPSGLVAFLDRGSPRDVALGPHTVLAVVGVAVAVDASPKVVDEFPGFDRYRHATMDGPADFGASSQVAAGAGAIYVIRHGDAAVYVYNEDGNLQQIWRWPYQDQQLTANLIEEEFERRVSVLPRRMHSEYKRIWDTLTRPQYLPASDDMLVADNGDIWVRQHHLVDGSSQYRHWWVLDATGVGRGVVRVPEGFHLLRIESNHVLGRTRDDVGLEYIERRQLQFPVSQANAD